jgi:hypothetical protein
MANPDDVPAPDGPGKRRRGQPTKYSKTYAKQAYGLALLGLTDEEMAPIFDVTKRTVENWKKSHPDFFHSIVRGRATADAEVAVKLRERALGYSHPEVVVTSYKGDVTLTRVTKHYPPDTAAASLWLRNRQPGRWRATPEPLDSDDVPTPVAITVNAVDATKPKPDAEPAAG